MFGQQVIYIASADLTTLRAIFNGIAMLCADNNAQRAMIFGFALAAATWQLVSMTTAAALNAPAGAAGADLSKRAFGTLIPFVFALMLTEPSLKSEVKVESGLTGAVTTVANVPVVITFLPATASLVAKIVGEKFETAMQSTGTDYASLSAISQGFINPLKTLLTSRTAVMKLGGVASEVNSLLGTCLGSDSGVDYPTIARRVMFAGNVPTGTGPTSIPVWSGVDTEPTSIGMLLAFAAQNEDAIVTDIKVGTNDIATCADAAAQVASDIETALLSTEFKRVVQGAVNAVDQPYAAADSTITGLSATYAAARTAGVTTALSGGAFQANAELINLLFAELVKSDLECLRADGPNRGTCLAMVAQANEIERNNLQSAANGFESLMYAGAFANQIIAIIIGLGPIIIMFMMWSGVNAGRNITAATHMVVWPLLITNIGGELINAMTYISVSNFLDAIAAGGRIDHSIAVEVYKHFAMAVGSATNVMATLPILMSTIFALGESAALVKIGDAMGSGAKEKDKDTPAPVATAHSVPAATSSSVATTEAGSGGTGVGMAGAIPGLAQNAQFGSLHRQASDSVSSAHRQMHTLSEGTNNLADWRKAFSTGDYAEMGVSHATGNALRDMISHEYASAEPVAAGEISSDAGDRASGAAFGRFMQDDPASASKTLTTALDAFRQTDQYGAMSNAESLSLQRSAGIQQQFSRAVDADGSPSAIASHAVNKSAGFVSAAAAIGGAEFMRATQTNRDFQRFQLNQGHAFANSAAAQPYMAQARKDIAAGVAGKVDGGERTAEAMARHRAAVLLANDAVAPWEQRMKGNEFLLGSTKALLAAGLGLEKPFNDGMPAKPIGHTGVVARSLVRGANDATGREDDAMGRQNKKFGDWFKNVEKARQSSTLPERSTFTDDEEWAYQKIRDNGASEEDARKLAPLFADVRNDEDLQNALNFGEKQSPALEKYKHRPSDPIAAAAYDKVYEQMAPLKGEGAYKDAYEVSLLTRTAQAVDRADEYIAQRGIENVDKEFLKTRNTMAAALVDKDVYYNKSVPEILPKSVKRSTDPKLTIDNNKPGESGYFAAVYEDSLTGKMYVSNRGTELGVAGHGGDDWATNALQGLGMKSTQYTMATDFARDLVEQYGAEKLVFTGHSLGGGLASAQAVVTGSEGITFNSAGLHRNTVKERGVDLSEADKSKITAVFVKGEFLSMTQDKIVPGIKGGLLGMPAPLAKALGSGLTAIGAGPGAFGDRKSVNPMTDSSWVESYIGPDGSNIGQAQTSQFGALGPQGAKIERYATGAPMEAKLSDALDLHGESQVIFSLQADFDKALKNRGISTDKE
jgi:conjugal transfer mating pair stabilization protein TraG